MNNEAVLTSGMICAPTAYLLTMVEAAVGREANPQVMMRRHRFTEGGYSILISFTGPNGDVVTSEWDMGKLTYEGTPAAARALLVRMVRNSIIPSVAELYLKTSTEVTSDDN